MANDSVRGSHIASAGVMADGALAVAMPVVDGDNSKSPGSRSRSLPQEPDPPTPRKMSKAPGAAAKRPQVPLFLYLSVVANRDGERLRIWENQKEDVLPEGQRIDSARRA
jgi:hypothetical protein